LSQIVNFYRNHFWDSVDFKEDGLVFSKVLLPKLNRFMDEINYQIPDSLIKAADKLLVLASNNLAIRKFLIYSLASRYERSKLLGGDGVFVHVAKKYYINEPSLWDSLTVARIQKYSTMIEPLLVGKSFPAIALTDTSKIEFDFKKVNSRYSILVFYDPYCGNCKKAAPEISKMYPTLKQRGAEVFWICLERNRADWLQFIRNYGLQNMYNLIDIHQNLTTKNEEARTDFKQLDLFATPVIYILDNEKKILAKRIPIDRLVEFFDYLARVEQSKPSPMRR
jgi:peroxiredoxin